MLCFTSITLTSYIPAGKGKGKKRAVEQDDSDSDDDDSDDSDAGGNKKAKKAGSRNFSRATATKKSEDFFSDL